MDFLFSIETVLLALTLLFNVFLCTFLSLYFWKRDVKLFVYLISAVSFFLILNHFSANYPFHEQTIYLIRFVLFSAVVLHFFFYLFIRALLLKGAISHKFYIISVLVAISTLTPYALERVVRHGDSYNVIASYGMVVFISYIIYTTIFPTIFLLRDFVHKKLEFSKTKSLYVFFGFFSMIMLELFTVVIPVVFFQNSTFVPFVPIYVLIFLLFTTYAIIRHELFNVKVLAIEFSVFVLGSVLLLNIFLSTSPAHLFFNFFLFFTIVGIGMGFVRSVRSEVAQRKKLEEVTSELQSANEQLKKMDTIKTEFLSIASHQLRTPLSVIKGYVSLLQDGSFGAVSAQGSRVLSNIFSTNERLIALVDDFLNISKFENGLYEHNVSAFDATIVVSDVISELQHKAHEKSLALTCNINNASVVMAADRKKIYHIMYNFIDNAIKYTPHNGKIDVDLLRSDNVIIFTVRDSGIGFEKEDEDHFFEKFYRGKNAKGVNVGGTGLGLYVAREFMRYHKGRIWAKSQGINKGSEFGFSIPGTGAGET